MEMLARAWWVLVLRGVISLVVGVIAFTAPFPTMWALILLFGVYALVDGIVSIAAAIRAKTRGGAWGMLLVEGLLGIAIAAGAFFLPDVTAFVLVALVAAWAIATGVLKILIAIRLRRVIAREWLLALAGVFSIIYGALIAIFPLAGAVWLVFLVGVYAVIFGILMIVLGIRLRKWLHRAIPMQPRVA